MAEITVNGESKPYEYVAFPKVVYNAAGQSRVVGSERELKSLGKEWKESPAEFPAPETGVVKATE